MKHLRQYIRKILKEEYEELEKTKLDLQQRTADWTAREEPYQQSLDSEIEMYPIDDFWWNLRILIRSEGKLSIRSKSSATLSWLARKL